MSGERKAPSEFELIRQAFVENSPPISQRTTIANGDDASVHGIDPGMELVVSVDTSIAGVHWPQDMPLHTAAERAVCAALSDLAAMGAEALWVWVAAMATSADATVEMGKGVNAALSRFGVELAGGDTTHSPVNALSITVAGQLPQGSAMRRDRAQSGDLVWLVGKLGFSEVGLRKWINGKRESSFTAYFAEVSPKLEAGKRLRELGVRCCIDVSDGFLQDAGHICEASDIGMQIRLEDFPGWERLFDKLGNSMAIECALAGGEDYALLFTTGPDMKFLEDFATCIGICTEEPGISVQLQGESIELPSVSGYDHFG